MAVKSDIDSKYKIAANFKKATKYKIVATSMMLLPNRSHLHLILGWLQRQESADIVDT